MFESTSPFDDALAKPFLDEPVKKRWSLATILSTKSSALSQSWGSSSSSPKHPHNNHAPAAPVYQASDHQDLEEIEFKSLDDHGDAELGLLLAASPSSIGNISQEAYDLDFAILRERHQDITDINQSLLQINEIGKDLATVVHSQGTEIQDLETMAIESLDHASSGVSHIWYMQANLQKSSNEYKRLSAAAITIVLFVCSHWIYWSRFEADNDSDMPEHP